MFFNPIISPQRSGKTHKQKRYVRSPSPSFAEDIAKKFDEKYVSRDHSQQGNSPKSPPLFDLPSQLRRGPQGGDNSTGKRMFALPDIPLPPPPPPPRPAFN